MPAVKTALPFAAALLALALPPMTQAEVDPRSILLTLPDHVDWKGDKVKSAVLYGDPKKEGSLYVMLLRWPANFSTRPHSHPHDRMITVLQGTLWIGAGTRFRPETNTPVKPNGFFVDLADQPHYEITKDDGALIEIVGVGPDATVPREEK